MSAGAAGSGNGDGRSTYLIDASIYIFRAWHSLPDQFHDPDGRPTNAVYGFARFLCELLEETSAEQIALAFDESLTKSFRNEIYPAYKANREPAPEALKRQFAWCREIAEALGIPCFSHHRYEADDLIGTLARQEREGGRGICIVSGDKDLAQLIRAGDVLWDYARQTRYDTAAIEQRFGVRPQQLADMLALAGDSVDNIPGVPGIGNKTAASLLRHFGDLASVLERADEVAHLRIRGATGIRGRLLEHRETAELSARLTAIREDVADLSPATGLGRRPGDASAIHVLFDRLGFGGLMRNRCIALL